MPFRGKNVSDVGVPQSSRLGVHSVLWLTLRVPESPQLWLTNQSHVSASCDFVQYLLLPLVTRLGLHNSASSPSARYTARIGCGFFVGLPESLSLHVPMVLRIH